MAIKTRFVLPTPAFYALQTLGYTGTTESMFTQFCGERGITDGIIRAKAVAEGTTISEAVRRLVTAAHPELYELWQPKQTKPKPHQTVQPGPNPDKVAHRAALKIMAAMLLNRDDERARSRARDHIKTHTKE